LRSQVLTVVSGISFAQYALAGELARCPGDVEAALQAYGLRMRPLIGELQKIPPFVGAVMAPQTSWGIWVRN
jgi:hypothetical protein